jgi:hypothetical protein
VRYRNRRRDSLSEAWDLRWDDIDLPKRTIIVRRLKSSTDTVHYLERDELNGLKLLRRQQQAGGTKGAYVFINERDQPFGRMGIGRMIERAGEAAGLPFPLHVHMLRHSTGYALAARGMDTRRLQHFLGHASIRRDIRLREALRTPTLPWEANRRRSCWSSAKYQLLIEQLSQSRVTHDTALSIHSTLANKLKVIRLEWLTWPHTVRATFLHFIASPLARAILDTASILFSTARRTAR